MRNVDAPELRLVHSLPDSWRGIGLIVVGMARHGFHPRPSHRAIRAVLPDRLERGATEVVDCVLMARIREREQIERAGWFN